MPKSLAPVTPRKRGRPPKLPSDLDEGNRRRQLIEGAARLFRAKGFDGTSTRDIAAAAGMRSGSPFYHFDSKNALLYVVVQEGMAFAYQSQCDALTKLSEGASPREQLRSLVRQHFEVLHGRPAPGDRRHQGRLRGLLGPGARSPAPPGCAQGRPGHGATIHLGRAQLVGAVVQSARRAFPGRAYGAGAGPVPGGCGVSVLPTTTRRWGDRSASRSSEAAFTRCHAAA